MKKNLNLYFFLFIFTMINREFLFFGIDLRFVLTGIGIVLLLYRILSRKEKNNIEEEITNPNAKKLFLFYILILICNISWFYNGLELNQRQFFNMIILLVNNGIAITVFSTYRNQLNWQKLYKWVVFSVIILSISFLLIRLGFSLSKISGTDAKSIVSGWEHINIFGGNFRIAGYAEDANYATLFFIIGIVALLQLQIKKIIKIPLIIIFIIGICYSASKTIILACFFGIIYLFVTKHIKQNSIVKMINIAIISSIILFSFLLPSIQTGSNMNTMSTRYIMWNLAKSLFVENPIIGNGITSFRSFMNESYYEGPRGTTKGWYVQCHSTYWQIASEIGIIALIIFLIMLFKGLNHENIYTKFLVFVFMLFAFTFESIYLQVFIYIMFVILMSNNIKVLKKE